MITTPVKAVATACTVAAALAVTFVPVAPAKGGDGVRVDGTCSDSSTSKLEAKHDDGRIEVEFEVDQNRNGVLWNVGLWDNGVRVFAGTARTAPPRGSFEVRRLIPNRTGPDRVVARATNPASGERCRAAATL